MNSQPPIYHPPARNPSSSARASALCSWYLRSLPFGTHKDRLVAPGADILGLPNDRPDDTLYRAFMYLERYTEYVEDKRDQFGPKAKDKMDELPLVLCFILALELAIVQVGPLSPSELEVKAGVVLSRSPDFGKYGFAEPETCLFHSPPGETSIPTRNEAVRKVKVYPQSDFLPCGPQVCTRGMNILLRYFELNVIQNSNPDSGDEERAFTQFKIQLLRQDYIAKVCTAYLKTFNFSVKNIFPATPWDRVAVMHSETEWPWTMYGGALFLLNRYRLSPHYADGDVLRDVGVDLVFYASFVIASALVRSEHQERWSARYVFSCLGFPHAYEERTRRKVCKKHIEAEKARAKAKREGRKDKRKREEDGEGRRSKHIIISPGPVTSGISAGEYMGCDEGVVCTHGMVRLKDYMLAVVFKWDVDVHLEPERSDFLEFEKDVKQRFGYGVMLGQTIP